MEFRNIYTEMADFLYKRFAKYGEMLYTYREYAREELNMRTGL